MNTEQIFLELQNYFWENNIPIDETKVQRLSKYASLLLEQNEKINLISRKNTESVVENHVFISAFISKYLPQKLTHFLDIGTGGGLPGIPLGIMNPSLKGVLVDSIGKKIIAVNEMIDKLKLGNISAENSRVESSEFIKKYSKTFDLIVSRGTVPLIVLCSYAMPLINERAFIATIKGGDLTEELKKATIKYKSNIKKATIINLSYKPTNCLNEKEKKLVIFELQK